MLPASPQTPPPADRGPRPGRRAGDGTVLHEVWTEDGVRLVLTEYATGPRSVDGPVFLLVAGFAQNRRAFLEGPLPAALADRGARVYIGELRGHGRSRGEQRPPRWTIEGHVRYDLPTLVEGVRCRTGAERLHYVGHSMGGLLALAWLADDPPLASLSTMAAPLRIGSDRPIVPLAAAAAGLLNAVRPWREVPMGSCLGMLSKVLSATDPNLAVRWLQRFTALANPRHAPSDALERILANADPESPAVFGALLKMAVTGQPILAGYDLAENGRRTSLPWVAIHGELDVFAPPSSVRGLLDETHAGPRWRLDVAGSTHVDVAVGYHIDALVDRWWPLLFGGVALGRRKSG